MVCKSTSNISKHLVLNLIKKKGIGSVEEWVTWDRQLKAIKQEIIGVWKKNLNVQKMKFQSLVIFL